jgi:hypothetical protein
MAMLSVGACQHRQNCPAYSKGKVTGTNGSKEKARQLFPKKMRRN